MGGLFVCFNYRIVFEGISDFIHSTGFCYFPVNGPCGINYDFLPVEIKVTGGVSDIINIFQNYFSKYNSAKCFHGLTVRAVSCMQFLLGPASTSCLNAYIFLNLKLI